MISLALFLAPAVAFSASCARDPEQTAAVEEHEKRFGAENHEEVLRQFGGAYPGGEADYLEKVGEKLAAAAGLEGQCTFSLVNSDVVNAVAVPGCYIYFTRGLMALMNSEDELAAVLAHELGHVVADHSQQQQQRSVLRQLGVLAVALATGSEVLTSIAGGAAQLFTLRYSRRHEHEADDYAVRTLVASGYDPYAAADMLEALGRYERFHAAGGTEVHAIPEWGRTHPLTENRIESVEAEARQTGLQPGEVAEREGPFLAEVDGLLYGEARFRSRYVDVVTAPPGATAEDLAELMVSDRPLEHFLVLNDKRPGDVIEPGEQMKVIALGVGE